MEMLENVNDKTAVKKTPVYKRFQVEEITSGMLYLAVIWNP